MPELLDEGVLLGMVSDQNVLHFMDESTGECLETIKCDGLGRSALFSQVAEVPQSWVDTLSLGGGEKASAEARLEKHEDLMFFVFQRITFGLAAGTCSASL